MRAILSSITALILCCAFLMSSAHTQAPPPPTGRIIPIVAQWWTYRGDTTRSGAQARLDILSDPAKIGTLAVKWSFPLPEDPQVGGFKASPIVFNGTVFIGSTDGYFYALDAATGAFKWRYPHAPPEFPPPLNGTCGAGGLIPFGSYGIQSSASYANIGGRDTVIFGAPDPFADTGLGSARLFALDVAAGALRWQSDIVAHVTGCTLGSLSELHERIAYSSPLVLGDKVYVGVHDSGDNPIQNGKVVAVDLNTGKIDSKFTFVSTTSRGGGVWNSLATDGTGVYFTTGNTRIGLPEPLINHGLSMIRVDKDTGGIIWKFQPVPFAIDNDPDWAAGAAVMSTSCGELIASVQKDGWTYAVDAGNGTPGLPSMRWQFPPTGFGPTFTNYLHDNDNYYRPGAVWNDVLIITTGGEALVHDKAVAGYGRLHALNACATTEKDRVHWIADVPSNSGGGYSLGAPTVTGGIVFIGTDRDPVDHKGHLVVLGDPSVVAPTGSLRCSNVDYPPFNRFLRDQPCERAGFKFVPIPTVLANVPMPDGGNIAGLRNEPALANGAVFVGTLNGHVYMLAP